MVFRLAQPYGGLLAPHGKATVASLAQRNRILDNSVGKPFACAKAILDGNEMIFQRRITVTFYKAEFVTVQ